MRTLQECLQIHSIAIYTRTVSQNIQGKFEAHAESFSLFRRFDADIQAIYENVRNASMERVDLAQPILIPPCTMNGQDKRFAAKE
jgi:hypothetical protein